MPLLLFYLWTKIAEDSFLTPPIGGEILNTGVNLTPKDEVGP
jgi:hypothetical protein